MLALLMALTAPGAGDFDPVTGYRTGHYRGIIRQAPEAVMRVDAPTAKRLWVEKQAVFIDLTPAEGGQRDPVSGTWLLVDIHRTIPRAHRFPEAGRGVLARGIETWFTRSVGRLKRELRRMWDHMIKATQMTAV